MPSGNFVDVSRRRKTTTTSPKKAKALGGRGRNAAFHGVCARQAGVTESLPPAVRPETREAAQASAPSSPALVSADLLEKKGSLALLKLPKVSKLTA